MGMEQKNGFITAFRISNLIGVFFNIIFILLKTTKEELNAKPIKYA